MWGDDDDATEWYSENGYSGYESETIDPSPWALIGTVGICLLLILLLPLFVAIRQSCRKSKKNKKSRRSYNKKDNATVATADSDDSKKKSLLSPETAMTDAEIVELYGQPSPSGTSETSPTPKVACAPIICGADSTFFIMEGIMDDDEDDTSVYGLSEEKFQQSATPASQAADAAPYGDVEAEPIVELVDIDQFPKRRRWGGRRAKGLARLVLQPFKARSGAPSKPKVATAAATASESLQQLPSQLPKPQEKKDEKSSCSSSFNYVGFGDTDHVEVMTSNRMEEDLLGTDIGSVDERDFLTQLADEFDLGNDDDTVITAPDNPVNHADPSSKTMAKLADEFDLGNDGDAVSTAPVNHADPSSKTNAKNSGVYINMDGIVPDSKSDDDDKYKISVCCGSRSWFGYYLSSGFRRKVRKCASWDDEMKRIVKLAIPYTTHAVLMGIFELVEVAVIGQVFARDNSSILGAFLAVEFILSLATMLLDGAINSLTVLCSHAVGGRNYALAGKYCQLAFLFFQLFFIPITIMCWNVIDKIIILLGYEDYVAEEAEYYGRLCFIAVSVEVLDTCIHHMLDVCGFEWYSSVMDIIHGLASLVATIGIGMLHPDPKLWMIGAAHLILGIIFLCLNVMIVVTKNWLEGFWTGFCSCSLGGFRTLRVFLKTALPLSVGYMIEYCEWEILFVFAAFQGPAEVTVWGLLGYIWSFGEHVSEAVADASEVRVAKLVGSHRPALARYSSHKSLLLGVTLSMVMSLVILVLHNELPTWLTTDETLQHMVSEMLPMVCVGLTALTLGSTSWTIICAQGRTRLATTMTLLGTVFVTLPLASISTFVLNWNLQGLLASVVVGYALSGIINSFIMVTSNWERISRKVVGRNTNDDGAEEMGGPDGILKVGTKEMNVYTAMAEDDSLGGVSRKSGKSAKSKKMPATGYTAAEIATAVNDASESSEEDYDDYDWDELPKDGKRTAGYTKLHRDSRIASHIVTSKKLPSQRKWDFEVPTKFEDYDWDDLSKKQQKAATVLGYTQKKWDKVDKTTVAKPQETTEVSDESSSQVPSSQVLSVSADPNLDIVDAEWIDGERFEI
ncbi:MAG: hypothetical protein SGILL_006233, partial [Bacillariaceae sp.]